MCHHILSSLLPPVGRWEQRGRGHGVRCLLEALFRLLVEWLGQVVILTSFPEELPVLPVSLNALRARTRECSAHRGAQSLLQPQSWL